MIADRAHMGEAERGYAGKDPQHLSAGGYFDAGFARFFLAGQVFEGERTLGEAELGAADLWQKTSEGICGWGLNVGASVPVSGGTLKLNAGHMRAEEDADDTNDLTRWTLSVGYELPLSKRTKVYSGVGYMHDAYGAADAPDADRWGWASGIVTQF